MLATMDGHGPMKMMIDTGATSTFLSWKGLGGDDKKK